MKHGKWILALLILAQMVTMVSGCSAEQGNETGSAELPGMDVAVDEALSEDEAQTDEEKENDNPGVQLPFALKLEPAEASLDYSQRVTLTASVSIGAGNIQWASSDESVVSISHTTGESVTVTAINEGTATVTCSLGGASRSCEVTVKPAQTLQITGVDYPATLARGRSWKLQGGTVASTENITEVSSVIRDVNGVELAPSYTETFNDNVRRFEISGLDAHVPFSRITEDGEYTWTLSATDAGGRTVSLDLPINVVSDGETVVATEAGAYSSGAADASVTTAEAELPAAGGEQSAPEAVTPTTPDGTMITTTPGRNRVLNSAFEYGQNLWENWGEPTIREFVEQGGKTWCHITGTPNALYQGVWQNPYAMHGITATGYDTYTFSARVKSASEGMKFTMGIHWCDKTNILSQDWNTWTIGTEEQVVTYTMTAPSGTEHFNLMLGIVDPDSIAVHDIYFTDVKLEFGSTATAWAAAPEDAEFAPDGVNRILNGAFETYQENWNNWGEPTVRDFIQQDGKTWCHIISTSNAHWQGVQQSAKSLGITIKAYAPYTFSARVKAAADNSKFTMGIHWLNDEGIIAQSWNSWTIGSQEQVITFTADAPQGCNAINIMIGVDDADSPTVHDIYFTDVKFELGSAATGWTPAPEDTAGIAGTQ